MTAAIQDDTTVAEQAEAKRIAAALVAKQLAACVQVSGPVESTYRWKDQIEKSQEWVCTIKTQHSLFDDVASAIRELHAYNEPEIIALPIVDGSQGYLDWISQSVASPAESNDSSGAQ